MEHYLPRAMFTPNYVHKTTSLEGCHVQIGLGKSTCYTRRRQWHPTPVLLIIIHTSFLKNSYPVRKPNSIVNHQKFPIYVAMVYFFHRAYRESLENADNQHLRHVFPHVLYKQGLILKIVAVATFFLFLLLYRKRKKELCCILLKRKKIKMCCQTLALILVVIVIHVYIRHWKDSDYHNLMLSA